MKEKLGMTMLQQFASLHTVFFLEKSFSLCLYLKLKLTISEQFFSSVTYSSEELQ